MTPTREDLQAALEAAIQERTKFVREADKLRARIADYWLQCECLVSRLAELEAEVERLRRVRGPKP